MCIPCGHGPTWSDIFPRIGADKSGQKRTKAEYSDKFPRVGAEADESGRLSRASEWKRTRWNDGGRLWNAVHTVTGFHPLQRVPAAGGHVLAYLNR